MDHPVPAEVLSKASAGEGAVWQFWSGSAKRKEHKPVGSPKGDSSTACFLGTVPKLGPIQSGNVLPFPSAH